jgi:hypothetical protein
MILLNPIDKKITSNNLFLEFYGALIGDGWLGRYKYKTKISHIVGLSGHAILDRDYLNYCRGIILKLFNRKISIKEKPKNAIELYLSHKMLVKFFNEELNFPIGKKLGKLWISDKVIGFGDEKLKHVIRGIFDTDGSFFMDKVYGRSYPNIEIEMLAPELLDQVEDFLRRNNFKPQRRPNRIRLKGIKQVKNWMNYIGSNNPKHFNKYNKWLKTMHG